MPHSAADLDEGGPRVRRGSRLDEDEQLDTID